MNRIAKARMMRPYIVKALGFLDDIDALNVVDIFPMWDANKESYAVGDRVRFDGELYKCLQEHVPQEGWNPVDAPSLWAKVLIPDETVIPAWEQPGSTNGYAKGDKVMHNEKVWESLVDNNVWEPGAVGTETLWVEAAE